MSTRRHDIQHDDIQHNDIWRNNKINLNNKFFGTLSLHGTVSGFELSIFTLRVEHSTTEFLRNNNTLNKCQSQFFVNVKSFIVLIAIILCVTMISVVRVSVVASSMVQ